MASTQPERDRFGWTICGAAVRKQVSTCVYIVAGACTTANTLKTSLSFAAHLLLLETPVQLALFESYCLPLLTFAAGAVTYSQQQVHDLNVCWNTVYRTVFNFSRWESVKCFINGLGKLSLRYILKLCKVKFYFHLLHSNNRLLLDLFWLYYGDCYSANACLHHVFGPRHEAVIAVYEQFRADCVT